MSNKLPNLEGADIVKILKNHGFEIVRKRGSHVRMKHPDGQKITVPVHKGRSVGKGLIRKIIRDTKLETDEFCGTHAYIAKNK